MSYVSRGWNDAFQRYTTWVIRHVTEVTVWAREDNRWVTTTTPAGQERVGEPWVVMPDERRRRVLRTRWKREIRGRRRVQCGRAKL